MNMTYIFINIYTKCDSSILYIFFFILYIDIYKYTLGSYKIIVLSSISYIAYVMLKGIWWILNGINLLLVSIVTPLFVILTYGFLKCNKDNIAHK